MQLSSQYPRTIKFFETYVIECYELWRDSKQNLVKASSLALHLNHIFDYYKHESKLLGEIDTDNDIFRKCHDLTYLRDYANVQKHCELTKTYKHFKSSDKVLVKSLGWGDASFGEGQYGGGEQIVLSTDDDRSVLLSTVLQSSYEFWLSKLQALKN